MKNYLLKGGRVIDPASGLDKIADIVIKNGIIKEIHSPLMDAFKSGYNVIDAQGMLVAPALFDMHVHLREPGGEKKETFKTGLSAALAGGIGFTMAMPNTNPTTDNAEIIAKNNKKASSLNLGKVYFASHISKNAEGIELVDIKSLKNAGCVALKAFPSEHDNEEFFEKALTEAKKNNLVVICHAEILNHPSGEHSINSEIDAVEKILKINKNINTKIHFAHVSTAGAIELIKKAKNNEFKISAEVCPHHLFLTEKEFKTKKGFARTNPPLRDEKNRQAVFDAVIIGDIDIIATDHAPHSFEEKMQDFDKAPAGTTGLETLFSTVNTYFIKSGLISLSKAIEMLTNKPAEILQIETSSIELGQKANIAIFDLNKSWKVKGEKLFTKAKSSIFEGKKLKGKAEYVFINGELKYQQGKIIE